MKNLYRTTTSNFYINIIFTLISNKKISFKESILSDIEFILENNKIHNFKVFDATGHNLNYKWPILTYLVKIYNDKEKYKNIISFLKINRDLNIKINFHTSELDIETYYKYRKIADKIEIDKNILLLIKFDSYAINTGKITNSRIQQDLLGINCHDLLPDKFKNLLSYYHRENTDHHYKKKEYIKLKNLSLEELKKLYIKENLTKGG